MTYSGTDFYCDVALKEGAAINKTYESDTVLAFHHTRPYWPVHIVVVPKQHIDSFVTLSAQDDLVPAEIISVLKSTASQIEQECGAARILTNLGRYQDSKHLHFHVSSGEPLS